MNRICRLGVAVALVCGLIGVAAPARAQLPGANGNIGASSKFKGSLPPDPSRIAPPPALPGAQTTIAPADKTALDLPPTEALFDAINRGDIGSARDAISRGAELNGHNVLGMTPLELSVDLSRNDITFLLLSLRAPDSAPPSAIATTGQSVLTKKALPAKNAAATAVAAKSPIKPVALVKPAPPRQYAGPNDSGTPNPQAGFLGFGSPVP
jgi:hypothetical protein